MSLPWCVMSFGVLLRWKRCFTVSRRLASWCGLAVAANSRVMEMLSLSLLLKKTCRHPLMKTQLHQLHRFPLNGSPQVLFLSSLSLHKPIQWRHLLFLAGECLQTLTLSSSLIVFHKTSLWTTKLLRLPWHLMLPTLRRVPYPPMRRGKEGLPVDKSTKQFLFLIGPDSPSLCWLYDVNVQ